MYLYRQPTIVAPDREKNPPEAGASAQGIV